LMSAAAWTWSLSCPPTLSRQRSSSRKRGGCCGGVQGRGICVAAVCARSECSCHPALRMRMVAGSDQVAHRLAAAPVQDLHCKLTVLCPQ
jgi:hypothetical protein